MPQLISQLKKEHKSIEEKLNAVKAIGIGRKAGRELFLAIGNELLTHMSKEDEVLFPALKGKRGPDGISEKIISTYIEDMSKASAIAHDFFKKHSSLDSEIDFVKDYGKLSVALKSRMKREEEIFFPQYLDMQGN